MYRILLMIMAATAALYGYQSQEEDLPVKRSKDTLCVKYKFYTGDELEYSLTAYDSISIDYGEFLWKQRNEVWIVRCDSVKGDSEFYLSLALKEYHSKEYQSGDSSETTYSPWLGRRFGIAIDSLGNRLSFWIADTIHPAVNPGGAFQPYLFFPFGSSCNRQEATSLVSYSDFVPENGLPVPLINQNFYTKHERKLDTLGHRCTRVQLIQTSQGSIKLSNQADNPKSLVRTTSILNGHANLDIDNDFHIPVHLFFTIEQKLTLHFGKGRTVPGSHYINSFYKLEKFTKSPLRIK